MNTQRKRQVIVTLDNESRFTFPTVAKARRFAEKMARSHQVTVELS
jgi:hypothetical protein